jgi:hypothetical protein
MALDAVSRQELDRFKRLLDQLPELGAPDPDEGARLHAEKNAPWVNGQYSHLKFPPYVKTEYPKMLYGLGYGEAVKLQQRALRIPARGTEDGERAQALLEAQRAIDVSIRIVHDEDEEALCAGAWYASPQEADAAKEAHAQAIAQAAAESNWDDRRLGPKAAAERKQRDEEAEDHLVEVAETPIRKRQSKLTEDERKALSAKLHAAKAAKHEGR